jgi:hypothetical protein
MTLQSVMSARLTVGLLQGIALYLLQQAFDAKSWPVNDGLVFAPLLAAAVFVPIIIVMGLGNMRPRTLIAWAGTATALCAGLATYNIYRDQTAIAYGAIAPTAPLWFSLAAILFIGHALVASGDADRKLLAAYPVYFDVSWKLGVQLALTACFTGIFWAMLWLGAELFRLIKIEFLAYLRAHPQSLDS